MIYYQSIKTFTNTHKYIIFIYFIHNTTAEKLTAADISHRVDESSVSIGRRYARTDEIAIPFGITVDFETVKNQTVTLRERDSTKQVRATIDEAVDAVKQIVSGKSTWADIASKFPAFEQQQA